MRLFHFSGSPCLLGFLSVAAVSMAVASIVSEVKAGVVSFGSFSGEFVTVGDPGNMADSNGVGAVANTFEIMKYEVTNDQYATFLNSVAKSDTTFLYSTIMASQPRGGITRSGSPGSYTYSVKPNMGNKPVVYVSWFAAARYANWLHNGATDTASVNTGAYNVGSIYSGDAVAVNSGASFFIPTDDQWYKAAYYKGGSTNAGYWAYATQSDDTPASVTANATGDGSAGNTGNSANYNKLTDWNGQDGMITTVGTNGGASYYGAFDMSGNANEWSDLNGSTPLGNRAWRGGDYLIGPGYMSKDLRSDVTPAFGTGNVGFRIARLHTPSGEVPEPTSMAIFGVGALGMAYRARRKAKAKATQA